MENPIVLKRVKWCGKYTMYVRCDVTTCRTLRTVADLEDGQGVRSNLLPAFVFKYPMKMKQFGLKKRIQFLVCSWTHEYFGSLAKYNRMNGFVIVQNGKRNSQLEHG